jgi:hypothetical protein
VSVRVETFSAADTAVAVFAPGEEWVGAGYHQRHVLTLAANGEVTAIEGTLDELRVLTDRISAAVAHARP